MRKNAPIGSCMICKHHTPPELNIFKTRTSITKTLLSCKLSRLLHTDLVPSSKVSQSICDSCRCLIDQLDDYECRILALENEVKLKYSLPFTIEVQSRLPPPPGSLTYDIEAPRPPCKRPRKPLKDIRDPGWSSPARRRRRSSTGAKLITLTPVDDSDVSAPPSDYGMSPKRDGVTPKRELSSPEPGLPAEESSMNLTLSESESEDAPRRASRSRDGAGAGAAARDGAGAGARAVARDGARDGAGDGARDGARVEVGGEAGAEAGAGAETAAEARAGDGAETEASVGAGSGAAATAVTTAAEDGARPKRSHRPPAKLQSYESPMVRLETSDSRVVRVESKKKPMVRLEAKKKPMVRIELCERPVVTYMCDVCGEKFYSDTSLADHCDECPRVLGGEDEDPQKSQKYTIIPKTPGRRSRKVQVPRANPSGASPDKKRPGRPRRIRPPDELVPSVSGIPIKGEDEEAKRRKREEYIRNIEAALAEVRAGMTVRRAAARHGINKSTLWDRVTGRIQAGAAYGRRRALSDDQEARLVDWLVRRVTGAMGRQDLLSAVRAFLITEGETNKFKDNTPTETWLKGFLRRNPNVARNIRSKPKGKSKRKSPGKSNQSLDREQATESEVHNASGSLWGGQLIPGLDLSG